MKCITSMWDCIFWQCANITSKWMVSMMKSHVISVSSVHSCVQVILFRFSCILCVYCIMFVRLYHNTFGIIIQLEINTNSMVWNEYVVVYQPWYMYFGLSKTVTESWSCIAIRTNIYLSQPGFIALKFKIINYPLHVFLLRQVCIIVKE